MILAIFDLQVTPMLSTKFLVNSPFCSGEEVKNRFSRWPPWRPSWISDRNDFSSFFIYKSPRCFLPSFESSGFSVQEKKWKIDLQDGVHGGHLGFLTGTIVAFFDLQVTPMLPTKFLVNWPRGVGGVGFKAIVDATQCMTNDERRMTDDGYWLTDHNSLPWAYRAQVS